MPDEYGNINVMGRGAGVSQQTLALRPKVRLERISDSGLRSHHLPGVGGQPCPPEADRGLGGDPYRAHAVLPTLGGPWGIVSGLSGRKRRTGFSVFPRSLAEIPRAAMAPRFDRLCCHI